jgi:phage-related protein
MAKNYGFEIGIGDAGNSLPAAAYAVSADRGMARQVTHNVLTAKFGDGYEQRALDGINTKQEVFTLNFNNRVYTEINLIAAFLDNKAAKNFQMTVTNTKDAESVSPTETNEIVTVACDGYNITYINENTAALSATFRRVFEPTA